ncbi:ubiquitin-binding protein cue5 [Coemansia sp. RSA 2702]|nr:hypothetical protein IWW52_003428 [Coemansia sp. RSA 2704]KAJ2323920.1 ubiquitin-binding protein cue5 [Coemansia sp. RSA 2702]KAJ2723514.1 ubiquitin-binding protein cue5 [Coemansia sp. Cherry 401B]
MTDPETDGASQLKQIFPNVDDDVIAYVLQSQSGNVEQSCNVLFEMTDPGYKPTADDTRRQKEIDEDAAYARQLAETELRASQRQRYPPGHASGYPAGYPSTNLRVMPPTRRRPSGSAPVSPVHAKKPSKIRDIFRFKRSRSGSHDGAPAAAIGSHVSASEPPANLDAHVRPSHTLDSDFSDTSSASSQQPAQPAHQLVEPVRQPQHQVQPAKPGNDVFGLFDDSNLDSYTPLSPSKKETLSPVDRRANPGSGANLHHEAYLGNPDYQPAAAVDLDHPFDDNPLLHASGPASPAQPAHDVSPPHSPSTNPFATINPAAIESLHVDNNPFRNRRAA